MSALVLALTAGAVVGLALGALGGGGGVLTAPALIHLLGFTPAAAATAGLVIVTVTTVGALPAHVRDGHVVRRTGAPFAAAGVVPAFLAGAAAARLPGSVLTVAFAAVAALAALRMLRPPDSRPASGVRAARAAGAGAGLGAVTGILGLRMRQAVGTSLLVIAVNSLAALAARAGSGGDLRWELTGPFAAAAVLGAWDGRRIAARVTGDALRKAFACALLAVAALMLVDAVR
ncbi:sulfite exporter TauE/SafE family protein [Streptomyces sp. WAC08241]|uniref:sulfite exporter TauE/SafE family protein n=1 Tax=Streptomyces sp. WAC08241 TaxID=2487421 RepID=UPI000F796468|nr:sulfite exporter TauE/SafE family protein [Streptomyces sp. WAC08241]RSS37002.1 sulfite exporter TauE/SafE family protein [Streptomyces sp. WAC08241]